MVFVPLKTRFGAANREVCSGLWVLFPFPQGCAPAKFGFL